jgi:hypothetical protein
MNFVYFDFFAETDICVFTRLVLGDGLIGWEVVSDEETTKKKKKNARKKIQIVTVISKRKVRH